MNILELQKSFIWLLFFNNLRKQTSHNCFQPKPLDRKCVVISTATSSLKRCFPLLPICLVGVHLFLCYLYSFTHNNRALNRNMTCVTVGAGTAKHSLAPEFIPVFSWFCVAQSLVFSFLCSILRSLFVLLFSPLCCLFFYHF